MPYTLDVSAALQRLREDVFARGNYVSGHGLPKKDCDAKSKRLLAAYEANMKETLALAEDTSLPEKHRAIHRGIAKYMKEELEKYGHREPPPKPGTIDELLKQQAENGTHSILDIVGISSAPQFGSISPFPADKLTEFFTSKTPSHDEIEEAYESGLLDKFVSERWQGIYIVAYQNALAHEIFFAGCSGD